MATVYCMNQPAPFHALNHQYHDYHNPRSSYNYQMSESDSNHRWNSMSPEPHSGTESSVSTPFVKCEFSFDDDLFGIDQVNQPIKQQQQQQPPASNPIPQRMCKENNNYVKNEIEENIMNFNANVEPQDSVDSQQIDIYRDLILRHLIQDISTTCAKLNLPTDPYIWNEEHSTRWINEMCQQFNLKPPRPILATGRHLLSMSVKDFEYISAEGGDTLHAQLQVWKTAFESYHPPATIQSSGMTAADNSIKTQWMTTNQTGTMVPPNASTASSTTSSSSSSSPASTFFNNNGMYSTDANMNGFFQQATVLPSPSNSDTSSNGSSQDMNDEDMDLMNTMNCGMSHFFQAPNFMSTSPMDGMCSTMSEPDDDDRAYSRHQGTVHLWQFIRELLDQPKQYSACVRWVDRDEGTFKIESSLLLARYWGQRKNRSQMNYDKLSRSLRQYYKKGIIQKPEKKQRLVYKFLPPYNM